MLLKPRLSWHTAALWGVPPGILLIGIVMLVIAARRRRGRRDCGYGELTAAEEARVAELLRGEERSVEWPAISRSEPIRRHACLTNVIVFELANFGIRNITNF